MSQRRLAAIIFTDIVDIYEALFSPDTSPMVLAEAYMKANQYDRVMDMIEKGFETHGCIRVLK